METEDVVINLQEDNSFTLNCTYHKDGEEDIQNRGIRWQKQINGTFEDLAIFSPGSKPPPYIPFEKKYIYENRTELIGPNTSLSSLMIIKDPVCTDEGTYKCLIVYYFPPDKENKNDAFSVVVFNGLYIFSI